MWGEGVEGEGGASVTTEDGKHKINVDLTDGGSSSRYDCFHAGNTAK